MIITTLIINLFFMYIIINKLDISVSKESCDSLKQEISTWTISVYKGINRSYLAFYLACYTYPKTGNTHKICQPCRSLMFFFTIIGGMFCLMYKIKQINTQTVQAIGQVVQAIEHLHIIIYDLRNRLSIS